MEGLTRFVVRRAGILLVSLVVAMTLLFVLLRVVPGDPANALVPIGATQDQIEQARAELGTDRPIWQQYAAWMEGAVRGDFGTSYLNRTPVGELVAERLPVTLPLTFLSFTVAVLISAPLGYIAAARRTRPVGRALSALSQLGLAVPSFWIGILLVWILALRLHVFPPNGFPSSGWAAPGDALRSLALPVVTIAAIMAASITRYVRSATLDVLGQDYLRSARATGLTAGWAFLRHGVRNAVVPVISVLAIELSTSFVGAVVIENVFALPGLGSLLTSSIMSKDYPVVQGVLFFSTVAILVAGFLGDLLQRIVDPRLRRLAGRR